MEKARLLGMTMMITIVLSGSCTTIKEDLSLHHCIPITKSISLDMVSKEDSIIVYAGDRFRAIREPFRLDDMTDSLNTYIINNYGNTSQPLVLSPTHTAITIKCDDFSQLKSLLNDTTLIV